MEINIIENNSGYEEKITMLERENSELRAMREKAELENEKNKDTINTLHSQVWNDLVAYKLFIYLFVYLFVNNFSSKIGYEGLH